jgi:small GTP-binding protein
VSDTGILHDDNYQRARESLEHTLERLRRCAPDERSQLRHEFDRMHEMLQKLTRGRVEIVVFGEISTGKSALINALVGHQVAAVDVQGGWTKEVWHVAWEANGWRVPGLAESEIVLVDTPGLNEVGGQQRADMARDAAERADLILFVTDSDLTESEYSALLTLAGSHKPIILVLNKMDLYSSAQRQRLMEVVRDERLSTVIAPEDIILTAADPRDVEYIIEAPDGTTRHEWRRPAPDVEDLKARILEVLEKDGSALLALNAAMYAADRSDRIATLRVRLREQKANQTIWSFAVLKAAVVSLNLVPVVDVLGGAAVDATMVATLSHIYGLQMSWVHARRLVTSIVQAAGWVMLAEASTHLASMAFKALTLGYGTVLTAVPQGAAAGYGSYIVGQAAKYYFEHGASWGADGPKKVVQRILNETDKQSVIEKLKEEIRKKLRVNPHADQES